jgi:hypothetical protein
MLFYSFADCFIYSNSNTLSATQASNNSVNTAQNSSHLLAKFFLEVCISLGIILHVFLLLKIY